MNDINIFAPGSNPVLNSQTININGATPEVLMALLRPETQEQKPENAAGGKKPGRAKKTARPAKERVEMTLRKKHLSNVQITVLEHELQEKGWIRSNSADFALLFSGVSQSGCRLTWTGEVGKAALMGLFEEMISRNYIEVPEGFYLYSILEGHFCDGEGRWLTGLDKGDKLAKKNRTLINEVLSVLETDLHSGMKKEAAPTGRNSMPDWDRMHLKRKKEEEDPWEEIER